MVWTYQQVKAAIAALPTPAPTTLDTIAAALNAQTTTQAAMVPATSVQKCLYGRGKWSGVTSLANAARLGTKIDAGALAAQSLYDAANNGIIFDLTDTATATQVGTDLMALVSDGVLVAADITAVMTLGSQSVPVWQPALTAGDIQTAEAQP